MNNVWDYLEYISLITFSDYDAAQIKSAAEKLGLEIEPEVSDEDYVSSLCRAKRDKGVQVFLFYGMDSRLVEYGRDICAVMLRKGTLDFLSTKIEKGKWNRGTP